MASVDEIQVLDLAAGPELAIVEGDGAARAVVWPGVGATLRSLHTISLAADAHTVELRHPSEAVYYAASGTGTAIDRASGEEHELVTGAMVHIDAGTPYVLRAGTGGLELLGGPSPADERLYEGDG
jgi:mannose-6-phosphate isomerase-like protein (cupin superfamily)